MDRELIKALLRAESDRRQKATAMSPNSETVPSIDIPALSEKAIWKWFLSIDRKTATTLLDELNDCFDDLAHTPDDDPPLPACWHPKWSPSYTIAAGNKVILVQRCTTCEKIERI